MGGADSVLDMAQTLASEGNSSDAEALVRFALGTDPDSARAHVTLARLRRPNARKLGAWLSSHALWDAPPFSVDGFTLFSSILGPAGSKYTAEATFPLGPR